ncbi:hypothetical protein BD769DRAFT_1452866 [Suillus cothurnatus]|nr:hypothetical protein BD769DRAFT_1452866 [Suillus cothurnatus]
MIGVYRRVSGPFSSHPWSHPFPLSALGLLLLLEGIKVLATPVQQSLQPQDVPGGNEGAHLHGWLEFSWLKRVC